MGEAVILNNTLRDVAGARRSYAIINCVLQGSHSGPSDEPIEIPDTATSSHLAPTLDSTHRLVRATLAPGATIRTRACPSLVPLRKCW